MPSRRGFLKFLGKGGLAGAALAAPVAGYAIGMDVAEKGEDKTVFNFTCSCGNGMMAEVPAEEGSMLTLDCECGTSWTLEWAGDHFKTRMSRAEVQA